MMRRLFIIILLGLSATVGRAQCRRFITPNFGNTYHEQEAILDEAAQECKQKKGEFHASVETGVNAAFGRHNPYRGATFYTGINGTYYRQVNGRLMVAAGFDLYNYMGTTDATTLAVHAMAHYQLNDRIDGTLYVERNFGNLRGNQVALMPGLRQPMGYGMYHGGLFSPALIESLMPSTTVAGTMGIDTKRGGRIDIGFSFTKYDDFQWR